MEQATLFKPGVTTLVEPDVRAFYKHCIGLRRLRKPEAKGIRYLKFPLDALSGAAWE